MRPERSAADVIPEPVRLLGGPHSREFERLPMVIPLGWNHPRIAFRPRWTSPPHARRRALADAYAPTDANRRLRTDAGTGRPLTERPAREERPSGGPIHLRERLGQGVGEILEHIRRVIRFDQVIRG